MKDIVRRNAIDIRRLRYVLEIAAAGSFTHAAERLHVAQPALSSQVRDLERALGFPVFLRGPRGVGLTRQGEILATHARRILRQVDDIQDDLLGLEASPRGHVRVAFPYSVAVLLCGPLLGALAAECPRISLHVSEGLSGHVLEWLEDRQADCGIVVGRPVQEGLAVTPFLREDIAFITRPAHAALCGGRMPFVRLCRENLLLPSRRHGLRRLLDSHAMVRSLDLNVRYEIDSASQLIGLVEQGLGSTALSRASVGARLREGTLAALPIVEPTITRDLSLVVHAAALHDPAVVAVMDRMRTIIRRMLGDGTWEAREIPDPAG